MNLTNPAEQNTTRTKESLSPRKKIIIYVAMLACGIFWGLSFFATTVIVKIASPIEVLSVRWMISAIIFLILIALGKIRIDLRKKGTVYVILTGLCQPFLYSLFETPGIQHTSTSESSIIISTIPCITLIVGALFFRKRLRLPAICSIVMAFAGIVICTVFSPAFSLSGKWIGYVFLFCACTLSGFYSNLSSRSSETHSSLEITAIMCIMSGFSFQIISLFMGNGLRCWGTLLSSADSALSVLLLGIFCSCVCYILLNYALQYLHPAIATNCTASISTSVGVISGIVAAGDPFGWYIVAGLGITLTGVILASITSD